MYFNWKKGENGMIKVNIPQPNITKVNIPQIEVRIPKVSIPKTDFSTVSIDKRDKGYESGYRDGYHCLPNLSIGKDVLSDYWLGYSCGHRDGTFDHDNGRPATC